MSEFEHSHLFKALQRMIEYYKGNDEKMAQEIGRAIGTSVSIACPTTSDAVRFANHIAEQAKKMIFYMTEDEND